MFIFIQVHSAVFSSRNLRLCEKKPICWFFCSLASNILFSVLFFCFLSVLEIGPSWCHTGHCHFSNGRDGSIGHSPPLWQHILLDSVLAGGWRQEEKFFWFWIIVRLQHRSLGEKKKRLHVLFPSFDWFYCLTFRAANPVWNERKFEKRNPF